MSSNPKFCRIAIVVDDIDAFNGEVSELLGITFVRPSLDDNFTAISVCFGEHGLEPIQAHEETPFTANGQLIEVAIDVDNAEDTKALFQRAGYEPVVNNFLPAPNAYEYLFGRDFHNLPLMVCTAGDNETQMRVDGPFRELSEAPCPKIGCVTVAVDSIDAVSADLKELFGMQFSETDPTGLGSRAVVGPHRVKLVENPSALVQKNFETPLIAIDFMVDDVEAVKARLEQAGYPALQTRPLKTGGNAYYFGAITQRMPLTIYPAAADAEILGA